MTFESALERANRAAGLLHEDRELAASLASDALTEAAGDDHRAIATAHRVLANVLVQRGLATPAAEHIALAVDAAIEADDDEVLGRTLLTRMAVEIVGGEARKAVETSRIAEPLLPAADQVKVRIQRATALGRGLGQAGEAIAEYDRVASEFPDLPPQVELVLRMNRGSQHVVAEDLDLALSDLDRALVLSRRLENGEAESEVMMHLASAMARVGDVPRLFELHREILERKLIHRTDLRTLGDLADALMVAGMDAEALDLLDEAFRSGDDHMRLEGVELIVRAVHLSARLGRTADARRLLDRAKLRSTAVENEVIASRVVLAEQVVLATASDWSSVDADRLVLAGERLDAKGWHEEAAEARLLVGQSLWRRGDPDGCKAALQPFLERRERSDSATPRMLAQRALARALTLVADGDPAEARRALARGLAELDRARARIGAQDVRSAASDRGPEMARFGLELAVDAGRPRSILAWTERQRAAAVRMAGGTVAPVSREVVDRLRPGQTGSGDHDAAMAAIRARRQDASVSTSPSVDRLVASAEGHRLIEFVDVRGSLCALTIVQGRVEFTRDLAATVEVEALIDRLLFGLRRMAAGSDRRASSAAELVESLSRQLDSLLLRPLPGKSGAPVIVPTGNLHLVPWRALPSLRDASFVVVPSGHLWASSHEREAARGGVSAVMGRDVPAALSELQTIAAIWGEDHEFEPAAIGDALDCMERSSTVHVCAHGRFRNDNAFLSCLEMADGPLHVYDLETLARIPSLIVLSACSVGAVDVLRGDDVLGFPAAILARGARSLIAALFPVEDEAARDLMVDLHRNLASGRGAARSLAAAASAVHDRSPRHFAAAAGFQCFGAA